MTGRTTDATVANARRNSTRHARAVDTACAGSGNEVLRSACARVKAAGYMLTNPRIQVLKSVVLLRNPRSFEEIHADLAGRCDPSTVYRTLQMLVNLGIVRLVFGHRRSELYVPNSPDQGIPVLSRSPTRRSLGAVRASRSVIEAIRAIEGALRGHGYRQVRSVVQFFADPTGARARRKRPLTSEAAHGRILIHAGPARLGPRKAIDATFVAPEFDFASLLHGAGLRVTKPRMAILAFLRTRKIPVTVDEVFTALPLKGCDIVTVYRSIEAFDRAGLIKRYYRKDGAVAALLAHHPDRLFIESEHGFEPVAIGAKAMVALDRAAGALKARLQNIGYQNVEAVIEFLGSRQRNRPPREMADAEPDIPRSP